MSDYEKERDMEIALELGKCCHPPIDKQVLDAVERIADWGREWGFDEAHVATNKLVDARIKEALKTDKAKSAKLLEAFKIYMRRTKGLKTWETHSESESEAKKAIKEYERNKKIKNKQKNQP